MADPIASSIKPQERLLPIVEMVQRFSQNPDVSADSDVAQRTFHVAKESIAIQYHYGRDCITHSHRTFTKDGQTHIVQVDPLQEPPLPSALLEQY